MDCIVERSACMLVCLLPGIPVTTMVCPTNWVCVISREYLYDAYSDRDNIPLARAGGPAEQLQPIMSDQQQQQACALPATAREGKHISLSAGKKRGQRRYHEGYHDNAAGGGGAYEFPSRRDHDARFSDMAPKHWDLPNGAPPPRYLGPEYERPPPYYYPGPGDSAGRR
ncbi:Prominin-like protein [Gryllus bimaculatus]|nr:Prominin-like protein [Gryllus bimaculatus]